MLCNWIQWNDMTWNCFKVLYRASGLNHSRFHPHIHTNNGTRVQVNSAMNQSKVKIILFYHSKNNSLHSFDILTFSQRKLWHLTTSLSLLSTLDRCSVRRVRGDTSGMTHFHFQRNRTTLQHITPHFKHCNEVRLKVIKYNLRCTNA